MPFDGSGNYSLPAGSTAVTGATAIASTHNNPIQDIASALNSTLLRSGVAPMTGNLNANFNKIVGLAAGDANGDAVRFEQLDAYAALDGSGGFTGAVLPATSDGAALGSTSKMWSDLFLASGAVINFNNGDVTLTHSADTLTLAGGNLDTGGNKISTTSIELGHASDTTISRSAAGVIAVEGVTVPLNSVSAAAHVASTIELGNATDTTLSRSAAGVLAVEGKKLLNASYAAFRGSKGSTQTFSSTAGTVTWTEDYDVGGYFASNAWTPPAGIVSIDVTLNIEVNNSTSIGITLLKNGTGVSGGTFNNSTGGFNTPVTLHYEDAANGTDVYSVRIDSGASSTQVKATSVFSGHLIGST